VPRFVFDLGCEDGKRGYASPFALSEIRPIIPPDAYDIDLHARIPILTHLERGRYSLRHVDQRQGFAA
jgi:hypothetical protein